MLRSKMTTLHIIVSAMFIGASMTWRQCPPFVGGIAGGVVVKALLVLSMISRNVSRNRGVSGGSP